MAQSPYFAVLALTWMSVSSCASAANDGGQRATTGGMGGMAGNFGGVSSDSGARLGGGMGSGDFVGGKAGTGGAHNLPSAAGGSGSLGGGGSLGLGRGGSLGGGGLVGRGGSVGRDSYLGGSGGATATATSGGSSGEPSAQDLLNKVASCAATATTVKSGFGLDGGPGNLSMYQCLGAVYWQADMDVDCDGIQTPPCDSDPQGQPQTSIVDAAPKGDVDPTVLPYFVIPLGSPETTWYTGVGIELGQVGAVIYKGTVRYGIFADEAGGAFIGEASYALCQLFLGKPSAKGDPCDPSQGGIDPAEVTYVTFTGGGNRVKGTDIYDHDKHTAIGIAAAKVWISQ